MYQLLLRILSNRRIGKRNRQPAYGADARVDAILTSGLFMILGTGTT